MESEVEIMESAYGSCFKLISLDSSIAKYDVKIALFNTVIRFFVPAAFPDAPVKFTVLQSDILNSERDSVNKLLADAFDGKVASSMEICQYLEDYLHDIEVEKASVIPTNVEDVKVHVSEIKLTRFLIYFHHIFW